MINRNIFNFLAIGIVYLVLLALDGFLGVHTLSIGFLLSLVFFIPFNQALTLILILALFHDVRFMFPFGLTEVLLLPYLFFFHAAVKFFRSRMAFLYGYICVVSIILSMVEYRQSIQPVMIGADLLSGLFFVLIVYFYAIRKFQDFSYNIKNKPLRF
ncbi:MAG: hypothetical protein ABI425_05470 [Patescibacteria group bacterium]